MSILAVDPGAERCGWAIVDHRPNALLDSGVFECPRGEQAFQIYRLRLEWEAQIFFGALIGAHQPTRVVNETIPAVGGGNFAVATQSYLANCVVTTLHNAAFRRNMIVAQVSARTVQKNIGIKGRTGKVSKVGVRNGVCQHLPYLITEIKNDAWPWDRWDAVAIGLNELGYVTVAK